MKFTIKEYCKLFSRTDRESNRAKNEVLSQLRTSERSFNKIFVKGEKLSKFVYNIKKGNEEVYFYRNIPKNLSRFFPKFYTSIKNTKFISYQVRHIQALDLSVFYVRDLLRPPVLKNVLSKLDVLFQKSPKKRITKEQWRRVASTLILKKLNSRWQQYVQTHSFYRISSIIKQKHKIDLLALKKDIESLLIERLHQISEQELVWSHGDMCFSNILLQHDRTIKLIDPRGGSIKKDLYLPRYYDLAKLSQCIHGNYDGILMGKRIRFREQRIMFDKWLLKKGYDLKFVRLIEASLFLSLLPLHMDRIDVHVDFILAARRALRGSM